MIDLHGQKGRWGQMREGDRMVCLIDKHNTMIMELLNDHITDSGLPRSCAPSNTCSHTESMNRSNIYYKHKHLIQNDIKRVHGHWFLTNNKWLLSFSFGLWHCKSIILKPHTPSLGSWSSCHTFLSLQQYSEIPPDGISSGSTQGRNWITSSIHKWAQ